jgi:hypothetical protein
MGPQHTREVTVAIVGGSAVVGQALELLLQGLGYRARYEPAPPAEAPAPPLADTQLVVLAPGLSPSRREAALARVPRHGVEGIPVLELTADVRTGASGLYVRWPCRAEALARAIDAALGTPPPEARG